MRNKKPSKTSLGKIEELTQEVGPFQNYVQCLTSLWTATHAYEGVLAYGFYLEVRFYIWKKEKKKCLFHSYL